MPLTTEQFHRRSHRGVAGFLGIQFRPWSLPSKHFVYRDVSPAVSIECLRNINISLHLSKVMRVITLYVIMLFGIQRLNFKRIKETLPLKSLIFSNSKFDIFFLLSHGIFLSWEHRFPLLIIFLLHLDLNIDGFIHFLFFFFFVDIWLVAKTHLRHIG